MIRREFNSEKVIDKAGFFIFESIVQVNVSFFEFFNETTSEAESKALSTIELTFFFFYSSLICDCITINNEKNLIFVKSENEQKLYEWHQQKFKRHKYI